MGSRSSSSCQHPNPALAAAKAVVKRDFVEGRDFWVVTREHGSERADLPIFSATADIVSLQDEGSSSRQPWRQDIPGLPGVFLLRDMLTVEECQQILVASEAMGYTEDAPVSLGRHIRQNENCVWIANDRLNEQIFQRCAPFLPTDALGAHAVGLNARWRLYKYNPSDVFRPHTDGAWPGSGVSPQTGGLVQDIYGDRFSQLTWVLYLNDDFDGGATRFFHPSGEAPNEWFVSGEVPAVRGAVLCFWHGQHPLSPLHEGSLVTRGTKYIVRSDVLFPIRTARSRL